jgi:hypothetical protein
MYEAHLRPYPYICSLSFSRSVYPEHRKLHEHHCAPHASARYVSSLAHSRRCASTSTSMSYTTPAPNIGSVTSAASPNAVPASACTSVLGGARTPNATPVLWKRCRTASAAPFGMNAYLFYVLVHDKAMVD